MKNLVLITGGAGFIGSHTADALAKRGFRVRILDNLDPTVHRSRRWPLYVRNKGFELLRGDARKKADWRRGLRGAHYILHFAAHQDQRPNFSKFFEVNTVGTSLLYELVAEQHLPIKKVVLASTQFVYGDGRYRCAHSKKPFYAELRTEEDFRRKRWNVACLHGGAAKFLPFYEKQEPAPTNAYGLSKLAAEKLSLRLGKTHDIPTTILRYSIVQGARQSPYNLYSGAMRIFTTQALRGRPITVFEDGAQMRDFVNIKDVVAANILALRNSKTDFEILNVGGGKAYRVLDFARLVKRLLHSSSPIKIGGFRRTDTRHAVSDISKLTKLGWRPRYSPEDSVREYLAWYREDFRKR